MRSPAQFWTDPCPEPVLSLDLSQALYFDIETRLSSDDWHELKTRGGVGLMCIWDESSARPYFYDDTDLSTAVEMLESAPLVVSFNGKWFDLPLLSATFGREVVPQQHFDIFEEVKIALDREKLPWKGNRLGDLARNTLGKEKSGHGKDAPGLIRDGFLLTCANYCCTDTLLTRELAQFVVENGFVRTVGGRELRIEDRRAE